MKYCCKSFEKQTCKRNSGFEFDYHDKIWNINGCCGGGCFVVINMLHCPYCGTELNCPNEVKQKGRINAN